MQNPFEYNINEQRTLISFFTQRKAKYKKVAEGEFKITEMSRLRKTLNHLHLL